MRPTILGWETGVGIFENEVLKKMAIPLEEPSLVEQRKSARICLSVPVSYRVLDKTGGWKTAEAKDVSLHGIRVAVPSPVEVGTQMDLEFKLPEIPKPFRIRGTVVWVEPFRSNPWGEHARATTIQCGVAFEDLRRVSRKGRLIAFVADKLCSFSLQHNRDLICRPAESLEELESAYRLIYKEYLARGYCEPNPNQIHCNFFCLLPESRTFIVKKGELLLGTISLIVDSPCGLPMGSLFPDQIARQRAPGRRLAEVSLLALDLEAIGERGIFSLTDLRKQAVLFRLFKIMFNYARFVGATDLVIGVHPKHETLYRYLMFEPIGPVRSYSGACGKPALPMRMDIRRVEETLPRDQGKGSYFLRESIPRETLEKRFHWTPETIQEVIGETRPSWDQLSPDHRDYLLLCYPGLAR